MVFASKLADKQELERRSKLNGRQIEIEIEIATRMEIQVLGFLNSFRASLC